MRLVTVPGIFGSPPSHWQSLWELEDPGITRFGPASWDEPDLDNWVSALDEAVAAAPTPVILVAHSLGTLTVAHWAARVSRPVAGAFLVSIPDPEGSVFPVGAASFRDVPRRRLPFRSMAVLSTSDPYATLDRSREIAGQWGSEVRVVGPLGHVNEASGVGHWDQGRQLLEEFERTLAR